MTMKTGIEMIAAERERQITAEGWTAAHDDKHTWCEMAEAAALYTRISVQLALGEPPEEMRDPKYLGDFGHWPWADSWWKLSDDPIRNLVKAGALIAAEIDRLSRQNEKSPSVGATGN